MALNLENTKDQKVAKKKPVKKAKVTKKTTKTPKSEKNKIKKTKTIRKNSPKKATIKKETAKANNSEDKSKKDTTMNAEENTHAGEKFTNAKLENTGNMADKVWRLIAMTAFAFIANFALFAIVVLSAMQFIVVFMEDKPNSEVQSLVGKLGAYLKETFNFLSYKTDVMPFPFSSFPKAEK